MPFHGHDRVDRQERRDGRRAEDIPLRGAFATTWRRALRADYAARFRRDGNADVGGALPAVAVQLDLEAGRLPDPRRPEVGGDCRDVNEYLLPAGGRLDEAEAALSVPGFQSAFESHRPGQCPT